MRRRATHAALLAALLSAMTSACNSEKRPEVVPVQGKVTFEGSPVTKGSITFQPAKGPIAHGEILADGTYKLMTYDAGDGAVVGDHAVTIIANDGNPSLMPGTPGYVKPKLLVPEKYNDPSTSGLTAKVSKENKVIDFNLK